MSPTPQWLREFRAALKVQNREAIGTLAGPEEAERQRKALEKARELASNPTFPDPNLPTWWEGLDKPE